MAWWAWTKKPSGGFVHGVAHARAATIDAPYRRALRVLGEWDDSEDAAVLIRGKGQPLLWINRRHASGRLATWLILWGRRTLRDGAMFAVVSAAELATLGDRELSLEG